MEKYVVTVCETRQREIEVEAESAELAREVIKERWCQRGPLLLDEMDFDHVTIEAEPSPKQHEKITYLYVPVGKPPEVRTIVNDPENIRGLLKAHPIARLFEEDVALMSQGNGAPLNRALYGEKHDLNSIIQGNFFIVNATWYQRKYESLTPKQIKKYRERFQYPEKFVKNGDKFSIITIKTKPKAYAR